MWIAEYVGPGGAVVIPPELGGLATTVVGASSFESCTALTSVSIPASVKDIGNHAFHDCTALTTVTLHEGLEVIAGYAFWGCGALASLTIPRSVTHQCALENGIPFVLIDGSGGSSGGGGTGNFKLWGKETSWEKSILNWLLLIFGFGWIWMAF